MQVYHGEMHIRYIIITSHASQELIILFSWNEYPAYKQLIGRVSILRMMFLIPSASKGGYIISYAELTQRRD